MPLAESTIQRQIIDYLKMLLARGAVAWFCRVNGGAALYDRQTVWNYTLTLPGFENAHDGYSDLHGMLSDGRYFAIEVKRKGKKPTKPQRRFLDAVRNGNGIAVVAYRFEDVQTALRIEL
jgi:hypothetical protein